MNYGGQLPVLDDSTSWINRAEQVFKQNHVPKDQWIKLASRRLRKASESWEQFKCAFFSVTGEAAAEDQTIRHAKWCNCALASSLATATPEDQRTILGTHLYPLVEELEHEMAPKVTGMLLEMDQTEVLHLLESPEALKAKVAEAMEVWNAAQQKQQPTSNPADEDYVLIFNDCTSELH